MIGYVPSWLVPLLGTRERMILDAPNATTSNSDVDGNFLPAYQQRVIAHGLGDFTIDSKRRMIIS